MGFWNFSSNNKNAKKYLELDTRNFLKEKPMHEKVSELTSLKIKRKNPEVVNVLNLLRGKSKFTLNEKFEKDGFDALT